MRKINILLVVFALELINSCIENNPEPIQVQVFDEFGIGSDLYSKQVGEIQDGQNISTLLSSFGLSYFSIDSTVKISENVCDLKKIAIGNKYSAYFDKETKKLVYFVYEINPIEYCFVDFGKGISVNKRHKDFVTIERIAAGRITSSLYKTLQTLNVDEELAIKLSEIFAWEIDFYRLQEGDKFKVVFDEIYVNGEFVKINNILSAQFESNNESYFAFGYNQDNQFQYFNEEGKSLRKQFLQSPIKFCKISSGYSLKRFHPVQKKYKAHLGTDYAAPQGTPILSIGDGTVIEAAYKQFNGNYVKIRHNETYTTQYLHMSKFAGGIRAGSHVAQGQIIGFVGSTGLATGPHVCFRFWKNNQQVDHRREKFPPSFPVSKENEADFIALRDYYLGILSSIEFHEPQINLAQN